MAPAGHRRVEFDVQPAGAYAVQLRLTPALLEALLRAQETGERASIRFGSRPQDNAVSVGDADFRFTALAEPSCDLLHLPAGGGAASLVGAVRQKLMVARNMEDERLRVRARGEEAERRGNERKAQLLDGKPKPCKKGTSVVQRRVTPPPPSAPRGITPPPQLTNSMLAPAAPAGRPPTHPGAAAASIAAAAAAAAAPPAVPPAVAAPCALPSKPLHKSSSAGKLGLTSKSSSAASLGAGSLQLAASARVLQAARNGVPLRLMLIAILAERPMSLSSVKAVLGDASARVKVFKMPKKDELERTIKAVAEFRTPGIYVVYPMLLSELEALPAAAPEKEKKAGGARGRSSTPPEQQWGASPGLKNGEAPASAPPAAGRAVGKQKKGAAAGTAGMPAGASAAATAAARKPAAGSKRSRLDDWSDDASEDEGLPPTAQRVRQQAPKAASEPAPWAGPASAASPPSVGGGPGGSSSSGGLTAPPGGAQRTARRSSSSRGSDRADDSWIEEHADRQPEAAAPITSREEYREREAAFTAKYEVYFALHQLIEAHKKDFEALDAAMRSAGSAEERERHHLELERLHKRRGTRATRWDAAYRVLHQELAAAKSRMAEFVQRLQQQGGSSGGTPLEALPAVRVK